MFSCLVLCTLLRVGCGHKLFKPVCMPLLPLPQVVRSRLQQRMDARALQYTGVVDVVRKTMQVGRAGVGWLLQGAGGQRWPLRHAADMQAARLRYFPQCWVSTYTHTCTHTLHPCSGRASAPSTKG
jgi:hypothetical protein